MNFYWVFEVLNHKQPIVNVYHFTFYWVTSSVDTSRSPTVTSNFPTDTSLFPIGAEVAQDRTRWWVVQLFQYINIGGFLHLPLESGECNTSRTEIIPGATHKATGDWTDHHIQLIERCGWVGEWLVSTLSATQ